MNRAFVSSLPKFLEILHIGSVNILYKIAQRITDFDRYFNSKEKSIVTLNNFVGFPLLRLLTENCPDVFEL